MPIMHIDIIRGGRYNADLRSVIDGDTIRSLKMTHDPELKATEPIEMSEPIVLRSGVKPNLYDVRIYKHTAFNFPGESYGVDTSKIDPNEDIFTVVWIRF